jgi:hypothetical protein
MYSIIIGVELCPYMRIYLSWKIQCCVCTHTHTYKHTTWTCTNVSLIYYSQKNGMKYFHIIYIVYRNTSIYMAFKVIILHGYTIFHYPQSSPCSPMFFFLLSTFFPSFPMFSFFHLEKASSVALLKLLYPCTNMPFSSCRK